MNPRQYKKLCKKAAAAIGFKDCDLCDENIWHVGWQTSGMDYVEWESEPAWDWLVNSFHESINMFFDVNDPRCMCGPVLKDDKELLPATPKNVFAWAKMNYFAINEYHNIGN